MVGPPKKHFFPFLLLSLCALFLYSSYHHSSLPLSTPSQNSEFTHNINPIPNHIPPFTLILKLLTFNRLSSLTRCLHSLSNADYLSDRVDLHIYIDHFALTNDSKIDQKLEESRAILEFVDGYKWKFGNKMVHYRTSNVGLQGQWLEGWWPSSDDEFVFVLEDDLEVSPLFYKFLRTLILNYYYNTSNFSPYIYGASLQRPRFVPGAFFLTQSSLVLSFTMSFTASFALACYLFICFFFI